MAGLSELIVFPGGQLPRKRLQDTDNFGTGFEGTSGRFVVKTTFQRSTGFTATMRTFSVSNVFSDVPRNKSAVRALGGASFQFAVLLLVVDACVWGGGVPQQALEARGHPASLFPVSFHRSV